MMKTPDEILRWTELDFATGKRILKDNVPLDVKKKAIEFERNFYHMTARRRIINIDINDETAPK